MKEKAKESDSVTRARKKLTKQLAEERERITPHALRQASLKIIERIQRTAQDRKSLKEKQIGLFDANRHSEVVSSQFVTHLRNQIAQELSSSPSPLKTRRFTQTESAPPPKTDSDPQ